MTKHDFVSFVSGELRQGAVRFLLLLTAKEKLFCTGLIKQEYESGGY